MLDCPIRNKSKVKRSSWENRWKENACFFPNRLKTLNEVNSLAGSLASLHNSRNLSLIFLNSVFLLLLLEFLSPVVLSQNYIWVEIMY